MRLVVTSDTHNFHKLLHPPDGDVLIHAGDMTRSGTLEELAEVNDWLGECPHTHKLVVAGNHDFCFEKVPEEAQAVLTNAHYLQDASVVIEGLKFYGSPWQPEFHNWAFNLPRGQALRERWDSIPADVDVLITHGPPLGFGDQTIRGEQVGCEELLVAVQRLKPKVHAFGHIHEGYGVTRNEDTLFANAAFVDWEYDFGNDALVIDLDPQTGLASIVD